MTTTATDSGSADAGFVFVSRYDAIGGYPNPDTMCPGQCDGMGCYPQPKSGRPKARKDAFCAKAFPWEIAFLRWVQSRIPAQAMRFTRSIPARVYSYIDSLVDDWTFVTCEVCAGTGFKPEGYVAPVLSGLEGAITIDGTPTPPAPPTR